MNKTRLMTLVSMLFVALTLEAQLNTTVSTDGNPRPLTKTGWNLIFNDEFNGNSLNRDYWNTPTGPGSPCNGNSEYLYHNPQNVSVGNGMCELKFKPSINQESCTDEGAAISQFHWVDGETTKNVDFTPGTYIEIRMFLDGVGEGIGGAALLYGLGDAQELDLFEVYEENNWKMLTSYHFGPTQEDKTTESNHIRLKKGPFSRFNLNRKWIVFGLEWFADKLVWTLNGTVITDYDINSTASMPLTQSHLGISIGKPLHGKSSTAPNKEFSWFVDYVRVFKKEGFDAIEIREPLFPHLACGKYGDDIKVTYVPDVVYEYTIPYANSHSEVVNPLSNARVEWVNFQSSMPDFTPIEVEVKATFPSGYVETQKATFTRTGSIPDIQAINYFELAPMYYNVYIHNYTVNGDAQVTYTWELDGVLLGKTTSPVIQADIPFGLHTLEVSADTYGWKGCEKSYSRSIYVSSSPFPEGGFEKQVTDETLNEPILTDLELSVYPNPTSSIQNLEISSLNEGKMNVLLLNALGQTVNVIAENSEIQAGQTTIEYETSHLSSGIYYLYVTAGEHQKVLKIVKD